MLSSATTPNLACRGSSSQLDTRDSAKGEGVTCVQIPPRSPNCNAVAERFIKSIKDECLRHFVFFARRHLRYAVREYVSHYYEERFHQDIGSRLIRPTSANDDSATGEIKMPLGARRALELLPPRGGVTAVGD